MDTQATIRIGDAASVGNGALVVAFEDVLNDSRCPADVMCIRAGEAEVSVALQSSGGNGSYRIVTPGASPNVVSHHGFSVELVRLEPYPFSSRPHEKKDYVATFRVRR